MVSKTNIKVDIEFWGAGTARTLRPIWTAEELDLKYKLNPIGPRTGETQTTEYLKLNPKQKIPLMRHGDFFLSESLTICRYLRDISPSENILNPKDGKTLAKEDEWSSFIYGELDETSLYVMRRHHDLKKIYGEAPKVVESCRNYFLKQLSVIESALSQQDTLLDSSFSLADIFLTSCLDWALAYNFELPSNISKYHQTITNREAYIRAVKINYGK